MRKLRARACQHYVGDPPLGSERTGLKAGAPSIYWIQAAADFSNGLEPKPFARRS
jgi:hypothetical protein